MEINLTLTKEEASYIVNVLAELPTKTGAWTLIQKINAQAEPQIPTTEKKEETLNG